MKHDAIVEQGIPILERVPIPDEMIPADSRVEIDAKIHGMHPIIIPTLPMLSELHTFYTMNCFLTRTQPVTSPLAKQCQWKNLRM